MSIKTGYCLQFEIDTGGAEDGNVELMNWMRLYLGKFYHLSMDNFYTNLALFRDLLERQTHACGTVRVNRDEFPQWCKTERLNAGDTTYIRNDDILAVYWKDERDIFVLSSFHGSFAKVVERYSGDVVKPDCIFEYNQHIGGFDKCNQLLSYYAISKKSTKWWNFFDYLSYV